MSNYEKNENTQKQPAEKIRLKRMYPHTNYHHKGSDNSQRIGMKMVTNHETNHYG